jgi:hypothetical protein
VDEDGNLVKTPIPTSIVLVTTPTKMDYNDGETIDLSGAVVVAKMADGTTWTDVDHPNGHVSCTPEPGTAHYSGAGNSSPAGIPLLPHMESNQASTKGIAQFSVQQGNHAGSTLRSGITPNANGSWFWFSDANGSYRVDVCTTNSSGYWYQNYSADGQSLDWPLSGFTQYTDANGNTIFYSGTGRLTTMETEFPQYTKLGGPTFNTLEEGLDYMASSFGSMGTNTISLIWSRPGDGKVLSTTMEINVGTHTTESSSGTGGSGGGGTF